MKREADEITEGIRAYFRQAKFSKGVLGISGGVDSALAAVLSVQALGAKNVTALLMPEHGLTKPQNMADAAALAKKLGIRTFTVPINRFLAPYANMPWKESRLAKANLRSRIRALILYNYANSNSCLVIGTTNKTEMMLGYFTKYGDGAVDLELLATLYKCEVRAMARMLGVPDHIVDKTPTAELWRGQTDELELGMSYDDADSILMRLEKGEKLSSRKAEQIKKIMTINAHKSKLPPVIS
ncbi:MAG TPA: NAD+ synthase [Candidatus Nanoarchaeia archaeon]|nr:NAD+ synthase [Candidatus Nanoarchaeia archaeon]